MIFDKNNTKKYVLNVLIFLVGMLSVSVSNVFGGYYCSVAVIETVLFTMFIYNLFDNQDDLKDNMVFLILSSIITGFGILFFVVNDIFNVTVYSKNNLDFWGCSVIVSQLLSIASIVYMAVYIVVGLNKSKIEVVEHENKNIKENNVSKDEYNEKEVVLDDPKEVVTEEIKGISENTVKIDVPFMEEEK